MMPTPRKPRETRSCISCGATFGVVPQPSRPGRGQFCSLACRGWRAPDADPVATFWSRVDRSAGANACWPWTRAAMRSGHGVSSQLLNERLAHRVAYTLACGPIPEGLLACHRCDNPPCCNPAHLFLGTIADNNADMHSKGRGKVPRAPRMVGEDHPSTKLRDTHVSEILASADSARDLAKRYGVNQSTISRIRTGRRQRATSSE
jgi:hypothetical protein